MNKSKELSLGIIVCARMTSKRFPGKSTALLHGKPVIQWVLERCQRIHKRAKVIVAVPDTDDSEPILEIASQLGIDNFCGSELDVLNRMYEAAKFFKFDVIMRITGDCPYIDPNVCTEVLQLLLWRKLDYASNIYPTRTYPRGLDCEVFTIDALEAANLLGKSNYEREHVTPWMQNTPQVIKGCITQGIDVSHKNFCVDVPEDIERLEREVPVVRLADYMQNIIKWEANDNKMGIVLPDIKDKSHDE